MRSPPLPLLALLLLVGALAYWLAQRDGSVTPPVDNQPATRSTNQLSDNSSSQNNGGNTLRVAGEAVPNAMVYWYDNKASWQTAVDAFSQPPK